MFQKAVSVRLWLIQALGLAAGGQIGTRLADRGAITTIPTTLLRHLMQLQSSVAPVVRMLGVDDFAWKKRHRYGTVLADLERSKIVEVLADRESATLERRLRAHPEVKVVSRIGARSTPRRLPMPHHKPNRWWIASIWFATWQRSWRRSLFFIVSRN